MSVAWRYLRYCGWLVSLVNGAHVFLRDVGFGSDDVETMMADPDNRFRFGLTVVIAGIAGLLCLAYLVYITIDPYSDLEEDVVTQRTLSVVFGFLSIAVAAAAWALLRFA